MRFALRLTLLAAGIALGTAYLGWWAVPTIGAIWGAVASAGSRPERMAAAAAVLAWAALLVIAAVRGPLWTLAIKVGAVLALPGWLFLLVTLAFPAILAGAAAVVGSLVHLNHE